MSQKIKKNKYNALIEVSKNMKDSDEVKDLLNSFRQGKNQIHYKTIEKQA